MDKEIKVFIEEQMEKAVDTLGGMLARAFETVATKEDLKTLATKEDLKNFATKEEFAVLKTDVGSLMAEVNVLKADMESVKETVEHTNMVVIKLEHELRDDIAVVTEDHITTKRRVTRIEDHLKLPEYTAADAKI